MKVLDYIKDLKKRVGCPYIYGAKQDKTHSKVTTLEQIKSLQRTYGKGYIWDSDLSKNGRTCCDCSGFIDYQFQKGYNSGMLLDNAEDVISIRKSNGKIDTSKLYKVPLGSVLWQKGHVGVFIGYIGNIPYYIAQDGSRANCRIAKLTDSGFTKALYNIKGYNLDYFKPCKYKVVRKTNGYTSNKAKIVKRTFKKGKKINAVYRLNNYVLCRKYSKNQDCWVSIRDLVEIK